MATSEQFSPTGSIQTFTVQTSGDYEIIAEGAAGGEGGGGNPGGESAEAGGTFSLKGSRLGFFLWAGDQMVTSKADDSTTHQSPFGDMLKGSAR